VNQLVSSFSATHSVRRISSLGELARPARTHCSINSLSRVFSTLYHHIIHSFNVKLTSATFNNASTKYIINPKACKRKCLIVCPKAKNNFNKTYFQKLSLQTKLEIWGKAQRESARRPKSDWGEIRGGGKISSAPKSCGPNSNALAYAERALYAHHTQLTSSISNNNNCTPDDAFRKTVNYGRMESAKLLQYFLA